MLTGPDSALDRDAHLERDALPASDRRSSLSRVTASTWRSGRPDRDRIWKLASLAAAIALAVVVVVAVRHPPTPKTVRFPASAPASLAVGTPAPAFDLPTLGGATTVQLAGYRGRPVVLNFFASWCQNCPPELPALAALAKDRGAGVVVLGVDSDDQNPSAARDMLAVAQATYPVVVDAKAQLSTQYLLTALPATYFIGRDGRVMGTAFGPQSATRLSSWVKRLTAGSASP